MKAKLTYWTSIIAIASVTFLVGCGGGSNVIDNGPPPPPTPHPTLSLPSGHEMPADTYTIQPGETVEHGNVEISCPADGMACVLAVASPDAETGTYQRTGGMPDVMPVLVEFVLPEHHGIPAEEDASIESGSAHHGRHGVTVSCPASGMDCVVNFTADEATYEKTGGMPEVLIHHLVWATNDQEGRAGATFFRIQPDGSSGESPVGYRLDDVVTQVDRTGDEVTFELDYSNPMVGNTGSRADRSPTLLDGLGTMNHTVDSNIPELAGGWSGVALSRSDPTSELTIHANVYSDIEADEMNVEDQDYMVLGVWLEVPDDIVDGNASRIGVFVSGSDLFINSNIAGLSGSATYSGPAIGIYEERIAGSDDDIRIGSFVATAELDADFDSVGLGAGPGGEISGTVTDFMENGQALGDWVVELNTAGIFMSGGHVHGNPSISRDGGTTTVGDWDATFYGNGTAAADLPTSIAGSFWGGVGDRSMPATDDSGYLGLVGAFGAHRDP